MTHVVELNQIDQLAEHAADWQRLWNETRSASFFQTLPWLAAYWQHFGDSQKLRVLVVKERGATIGILPLTVLSETTAVGQVSVLTYPLHDWGTYYGPLGSQPAATLLAGLRHIHDTPRDFEMLDLRFVDRAAVDCGRTPTALACAGFGAWEGVWKETAVVDLAGGWEAYWSGRTSKFRGNVGRYEKRTEAIGRVEFERYRPRGEAAGESDPRWSDFEAIIELASRTWQGGVEDGTTLSHASIQPFIRQTHAQAARLGLLDVNLLRIDGQLAAFAYNYHHRGLITGLRMGYDPQFAACGLGNVLLYRSLQDSFRRGDVLLDLGPGSLDIKRRWATRIAESHRYTHYPLLAPRAQLLRLKRMLVHVSTAVRTKTPPAPVAGSPLRLDVAHVD